MSTIKVRLKDVGGNVIHPETDWSIVQNKPSSYPTTWSEVSGRPSIAFKTYTGDTNNPVSEIWERSGDTKSFTSTISMTTSRIVSAVTMKAAYGGSRCYLQAEASKNEQAIRLKGQKILMDADEITVCDENTGNSYVPLNQYPINWSAIKNKPTLTLAKRTVLGIYNTTTILADKTGIASLAACYIETDTVSGETTKYYFYLNKGGTWSKFTPSTSEAFTPLTAYNAGGN